MAVASMPWVLHKTRRVTAVSDLLGADTIGIWLKRSISSPHLPYVNAVNTDN